MRVLRRRVQIITLLAVLVVPLATAHAVTPSDSRELWATVNVCDTAKSPDTIGVRASMPGSRRGLHERYVRFVVQYYSRADERWQRIAAGGDSGYLSVGKGRATRQLGRSFRIQPAAGQPPVLLRGRVYFQWRLKGVVMRRAAATTRKGHRSSAGDDPRGYSAATCTITSDG